VAFVLTGTVSRVDQKVRITGTLNNPRTDEAIWNKPDDKNRTDIFAIQAELAQAIAGELKTVLSSAEKKLVERRATEDPLAYDFFLKARAERYRAAGGRAHHGG
jgi:adenylate cyclase